MRLLFATLGVGLLLLTGCGVSERDVVGVYRLNVQDGMLELKADGSYVQTLKLGPQPEVRTGKWSFGEWRQTGKSPGHFSGGADGTFVYLENANAVEACQPCRAVPYSTVELEVLTGMMNVFLIQDPTSGTVYSK